MITITIKSGNSTWNIETKKKWLKFREWIEENGGKWEEGFGAHLISFKEVDKTKK